MGGHKAGKLKKVAHFVEFGAETNAYMDIIIEKDIMKWSIETIILFVLTGLDSSVGRALD